MRSSRSGTPISASAVVNSARVAPARKKGAAVWVAGAGDMGGLYHMGREGKKANGRGKRGDGALSGAGFAATVAGDS
jgi:hypothetical protein